MTIPIYSYIVLTIFMELVNWQKGISIIIQDIFNAIGTIIITTTILLYLYILKLYVIFVKAPVTFKNTINSTSLLKYKNFDIKSNILSKFSKTNDNKI